MSPDKVLHHIKKRPDYLPKGRCRTHKTVYEEGKGMKYKALIRLRKALVEHPFGTLKYWMGQIPLLLRGKEKVQAEIDLYATCYNLKRVTNIQSIQVLLQQVHYWGIKYT